MDEGSTSMINELDSGKKVSEHNMEVNGKDAEVSNSNAVIDVDPVSNTKSVIDVDSVNSVEITDSDNNKEKLDKNVNSYAKMVTKDEITVTKNLMFIAPKVNDNAHMCQYGVGRADYARVLVEEEAGKQMRTEIKIEYTDGNKCLKGMKVVKVEYDCKPDCCSHCNVFGRTVEACNVRPRTDKEIQEKRMNVAKTQEANKSKPTCAELKTWTKDMENYFNRQWDIDREKEKESVEMNVEDVMEVRNEMSQIVTKEKVTGLSKNILN
ncbi:hypothetical protein CTI12_AA433670 [Artemisia annua]|uniref:Uncharacterized protein n=1 Tax=Artemisia annua TaxID=35608 RepID=A0A2U1M0X7_ARTAN|nr:hypothetical protein CTI12_AA433670 [Artemisia annua]